MSERRRSPDVRQRRRDLCDAAIQLLAEHGAKGLSHPRVDRKAGVPDGSTSYYFRTRAALVHAVAERVAELDLADLQSVSDDPDPATRLASVVMMSLTAPGLTRTRARFELLLQASRDPLLSEVFRRNTVLYSGLHRDLASGSDQALVTMNFISGLMMSAVAGVQPVASQDHLVRLLTQLTDIGRD